MAGTAAQLSVRVAVENWSGRSGRRARRSAPS